MSTNEQIFDLKEDVARHIFTIGRNCGLNLIRGLPQVTARARGNCLIVKGPTEQLQIIERFIDTLTRHLEGGDEVNQADLQRLFHESTEKFTEKHPSQTSQNNQYGQPNHANGLKSSSAERSYSESPYEELLLTHSGRSVRPKTATQQAYVEAMRTHLITVAVGPAGTGKTYLAIAMAVRALRDKQVSRVILSRPTVEAGEKLGFLPGDLLEKVDPHFRPLYDALQEFLGVARFQQYLRQGIIEITPLAFMRGRTFNEAFIVLDEAQNTTVKQMRMFLTRMGFGSRVVVTGDRTQIDLPSPRDSALLTLRKVLGEIGDVAFVDLTARDVIRHELVKKIIRAYESYFNDCETTSNVAGET